MTKALPIIRLSTPLLNLCILVSNVVTIDNCSKLGASCLIFANIVNLGLDYIFLNFTSPGMYGAGLSTVIGNGVGNLVLIPYTLSKKANAQNRNGSPNLRQPDIHPSSEYEQHCHRSRRLMQLYFRLRNISEDYSFIKL